MVRFSRAALTFSGFVRKSSDHVRELILLTAGRTEGRWLCNLSSKVGHFRGYKGEEGDVVNYARAGQPGPHPLARALPDADRPGRAPDDLGDLTAP